MKPSTNTSANAKRGLFISLDGIDGAGKTTHLQAIQAWFEQQDLPFVMTREPGGTPLGESLRALLLDPATDISNETECLLMFAARQQHLQDVILPALAQGTHVISDRFTDATFAYQGGGRGLPWHQIEALETWVQAGLQPDLTLLLDVPLEVSMGRIEKSREKDRFEQEQADFFTRVRSAYQQRALAAPARYALIDAHRDKAVVSADVVAAVAQLFDHARTDAQA
ncbi:dTMP kinase [Vitreoscilla massiliensis]|uniref:Thymidylate kinase n=1 Tax=Vitreoscilla massiliensis TaxID=1689272 RepID=A0ABY4DXA9_9NEIS|nr:dTMP kinase [Vitreoscilla massiliensis]UOO88163.1 dTMP kinase [Vitreoscilla massiliensis]